MEAHAARAHSAMLMYNHMCFRHMSEYDKSGCTSFADPGLCTGNRDHVGFNTPDGAPPASLKGGLARFG